MEIKPDERTFEVMREKCVWFIKKFGECEAPFQNIKNKDCTPDNCPLFKAVK